MHLPVDLTVTPDGRLHLVDQGNLQVRTVVSAEPRLTVGRRHLEITSPDGLELYGFNRFGKHIWSRSIQSDRLLFNFSYHIDTNWGKLVSVTAADHSRLLVTRKSAAQLHLESPGGQRAELQLDLNGLLDRFASSNGQHVDLNYDSNGAGLLVAKTDSLGRSGFFRYDQSGRVRQFITPVGDVGQLDTTAWNDRLRINVRVNGIAVKNLTVSSSQVTESTGKCLPLHPFINQLIYHFTYRRFVTLDIYSGGTEFCREAVRGLNRPV